MLRWTLLERAIEIDGGRQDAFNTPDFRFYDSQIFLRQCPVFFQIDLHE